MPGKLRDPNYDHNFFSVTPDCIICQDCGLIQRRLYSSNSDSHFISEYLIISPEKVDLLQKIPPCPNKVST